MTEGEYWEWDGNVEHIRSARGLSSMKAHISALSRAVSIFNFLKGGQHLSFNMQGASPGVMSFSHRHLPTLSAVRSLHHQPVNFRLSTIISTVLPLSDHCWQLWPEETSYKTGILLVGRLFCRIQFENQTSYLHHFYKILLGWEYNDSNSENTVYLSLVRMRK